MTDTLATAIFRAGPQYELVPLDRLSADDRRRAGVSSASPQPFGVVRMRAANPETAFTVSADIALLFLTLREPGQLPPYFRSALGPMCGVTIARFVADGVLEIDVAGVFVSGPRGLEGLLGAEVLRPGAWETDPLSAAALRFATAARSTDADDIAARLYAYHRIPAGSRWRDRLASRGDVQRFLGIGDGCALDFRFSAGWFAWTSPRGGSEYRFKLYVSPQPGALRETVAVAVNRTRYLASAMKIGSDVYGLLRPDKFMIYFATRDALLESADRLRTDLAGIAAHGVPFTAAIGADALLSWGVDPVGGAATAPTSWRQWVTMRAAQALAVVNQQQQQQQQHAGDAAVWQFVRRRLALDGIDAKVWMPLGARDGRDALVAS